MVAVVPLLAVALTTRLATERVPVLHLQRLLSGTLQIQGPPPRLAWPAGGEAAVEIEHVGSLGASGPSTPVPIASVAKIMTAYLTLREHPLSPGSDGVTFTITREDVAEERVRLALDQSVVPVAAGERLSERQALQALLLPSANNIAVLLALHDARSVPAFLARMNATARSLRMDATVYTDPSGYQDTTVSTAVDQLKLAAAAMRLPAFAAIVDESSARLPVAGVVHNYNALVGEDGFVGVKTGSDSQAGGCLVFAKRTTVAGRHLTILGAVLGQREGSYVPAALAAARALGDSAARALRTGTVLAAGATVLLARGAGGAHTQIVAAHSLRAIGWGGLAVPVAVSLVARAPTRLAADQPVAGVSLAPAAVAPDMPAFSHAIRAVAARAVAAPSLGWRLRHLF